MIILFIIQGLADEGSNIDNASSSNGSGKPVPLMGIIPQYKLPAG